MLANTSCYNDLVFLVARLAVKFFNNFLRLHHLARLALLVRERVFVLPSANLTKPVLTLVCTFDEGDESCEI